MKRILFFLVVVAAALTVSAQDTIKITATFQNLNVANNNLPGVNASADFKIGSYGHWRVGAVVDGAYQRDLTRTLDRYQLLGGMQLSRSIGEDRVSVFGRGLFGVTRFDQVSPNLTDFNRVTVGVGGGVDIHFGKVFVRPAQFDLQWIDRRPVRYTRFGFGGGFRF